MPEVVVSEALPKPKRETREHDDSAYEMPITPALGSLDAQVAVEAESSGWIRAQLERAAPTQRNEPACPLAADTTGEPTSVHGGPYSWRAGRMRVGVGAPAATAVLIEMGTQMAHKHGADILVAGCETCLLVPCTIDR